MDLLIDLIRQLAIFIAIAAGLGLVGLALIMRRLRHIQIAPGASFVTTLRAVPLALVVVLDLLDFGLDFFATPLVWVVLSRYNLQALRNVAAVEDFIPFTGPIPTMTLAWLGVRVLGLGDAPSVATNVIEADEVAPGQFVPRDGSQD